MEQTKKESPILTEAVRQTLEGEEKGGKGLALMSNGEGLVTTTITTIVPLIESIQAGRTTIVGGDPEFHKDAEGSIEMMHLRSTDINPDDLDEEDYYFLNKWLTKTFTPGNRIVGFLESTGDPGVAKGLSEGSISTLTFFRPKEGQTLDEAVAEMKGQGEVTTDEHGNEWVEGSLEEVGRTAEINQNTITKMRFGEENEETSVAIMRGESRREDYSPEAVKELADTKRFLSGRIGLDKENNWFDLFEGTRMQSISLDGSDADPVYQGNYAGPEMICDDKGPLPGKWRVVMHASGHIDGSDVHRNFTWYSNQIKPTLKNVVAKVDRYLKDSGDWHCFLQAININHKDRTLWCNLGS